LELSPINVKGLVSRPRTFQGGGYLPIGAPSMDDALMAIACPERLVVPLGPRAETTGELIVRPGAEVSEEALLARSRDGAPCVHAPRAGRLTGMKTVSTADGNRIEAVEIHTDPDADHRHPSFTPSSSLNDVDPCNIDDLADTADRAGIVVSNGESLGSQLRRAATSDTDHVIINGLSHEPILTAPHAILKTAIEAVAAAGLWIRTALNARRLWLAIDRRDKELASRCKQYAAGTPLRIAELHNKYPQAHPILLAFAITNRSCPIGGTTEDIRTLVLDIEAAEALAAMVCSKHPVTDCTLTIAGPAITRPGHYRVPVGTTVAHLLQQVGLSAEPTRLIGGGLLTGVGIIEPEAVITQQTRAILALDERHDRLPRPGPCIHCGWCQESCPVGLDPSALLDAWERKDHKRARTLFSQACLSCGLCSYVCPSELPLAEAATGTKAWMQQTANLGRPNEIGMT